MARKVIGGVSINSDERDNINDNFAELYAGGGVAVVGVNASGAELNYNDITTLGTGAASKAVVLDAGEDYIWPATGILKYGVLKDPAGTTLTSTVAELNKLTGVTATSAELNYVDIAALGTGAASKAVVLDASGNYVMPVAGVLSLSRGTLAALGSAAGDAAVVTQQISAVIDSDGTKGIALPAAATTTGPMLIVNTVQTTGATLKVYPVSGGNDNINALAEDAAFVVGPGMSAWFIPTSATQWYCSGAAAVTATAAELNTLTGVTSTAAEINTLASVTAGTVAASKAVVVDANKDVGDFRNLDCVNLDVGASGTAGTIDLFPATVSRGSLKIQCGEQTGNTIVYLSIGAMGQSSTITIPDPGGASGYVVMTSAALALAEADVLQGALAGTQVASKAVIANSDVNIGVAKVTALHIGSTGAETQVTATAAELNKLASMGATTAELNFAADVSSTTETLIAAGAVSVLNKITSLELVNPGGAITLDVPNAIMAGQIKTIRMTVDNGDVTMALTNVNNVAGASAGTTCTFSAVGQTLILAACGPKWTVIGIAGAVIS